MTSETTDPHPRSAELGRTGAAELGRLYAAGSTTAAEVTALLLERIAAVDEAGPAIRSVLRVNPSAVEEARALDEERVAGRVRSPLHGVPVLVKDNIDTDGLGATAGSACLDGAAAVDAPLVRHLREAGLVLLGKSNLSEWANFRGRPSSSGWSALGGQTRNPFALDRTPGGSSAGSGAALAAGFAPLTIGTETDGSILCPSAACGTVGIKPTVGLVSRTGIVPISASQDTAGAMARSVEDAALLLAVLGATGVDPDDASTAAAPAGWGTRFAGDVWALGGGAGGVAGMRVGVVRDDGYHGYHAGTDALVEAAAEALRQAGADVIDPVTGVGTIDREDEIAVLCAEFRAGLAVYLARRSRIAPGLPKSLDDVIAFNEANPAERLDLFAQDLLVRSAGSPGLDDDRYLAARAANLRRTREEGIDAVCDRLGLDALVAPTMPPAWGVDHVLGDRPVEAAWSQAAIAGYPSLSVPIGSYAGLPVGLAIWGRAWSEPTLVRLALAVESAVGKAAAPGYLETVSFLV